MYLKVMIFVLSAGLLTTGNLWAFQAGGAAQRTVWDGVYSDAQATSGQALYTQYCTRCHMPNLSGGGSDPALTGEKFIENWREDRLESLFRKIKTTMPRNSTRVLDERETLDALSYILRENGFPSGEELTVAGMRDTMIQLKDGPRPLPNYAQVEVVGCLTQQRNTWTLTMVNQPRRVRGAAEKPTAEEIKAAAGMTLGNLTFPLQNLLLLGGFEPAPHAGHKMLARGALIRRSGTDNISVTALEMVGESCAP